MRWKPDGKRAPLVVASEKKRDDEEKELHRRVQNNNDIPLDCYESILFHFILLLTLAKPSSIMAKSISFQYVWIGFIGGYVFFIPFSVIGLFSAFPF